MPTNDWSTFTKRIPVYATVENIYRAWTTQQGLENWFLRHAGFSTENGEARKPDEPIAAGDQAEWGWFGYAASQLEQCRIFAANGKDFLQFSFAGDCLVSVRIRQEEGFSIVELTQENIPDDDNPSSNLLVGCGEGWVFYLANLKSMIEGGIDLRNKDERIKRVISS